MAAMPWKQRIELGRAFARDIALLKRSGHVNPIVVHGGGPPGRLHAGTWASNPNSRGAARHRPEDGRDLVEMVLAGSINSKEIVALINAEGGMGHRPAMRQDGNMVFARGARPWKDPDSNIERVLLDLGFVRRAGEVDRTLLDLLALSEMIPVIARSRPARGHTYNISTPRYLRGAAGALSATAFCSQTDVPSVLDRTEADRRADRVTGTQADRRRHHFRRRMIPKGGNLHRAIERGVEGVVILSKRTAHSVLLRTFHRTWRGRDRALTAFETPPELFQVAFFCPEPFSASRNH